MKISGPINIVRLDGKVGGRDKVVYLYMDIHINPDEQTECNDFNSISIREFMKTKLAELEKKNKNIYDLFIEVHPITYDTKIKSIYLQTVRSIFRRSNGNLKNTRLHYIDIRYEFLFAKSYKLLMLLPKNIYDLDLDHSLNKFQIYLENIKMIIDEINYIYGILYNKKINEPIEKIKLPIEYKNITEDVIKNVTLGYLNKILFTYNNEQVKIKLNEILDKELIDTKNIIHKLEEQYKELSNIYNHLNKYAIKDVFLSNTAIESYYIKNYMVYGIESKLFIQISLLIVNIYYYIKSLILEEGLASKIIDIYLLRRLLDKNDIKTGLVYTGSFHSLFYIYNLVNNFDFTVTHASYTYGTINNINNIIKKSDRFESIAKYFYPNEIYQCSDIISFPPDLT